ncbi:MAG TPA: hypothetical protein DEP47_09580 [Chloroflexi bacterium]|nr:hypothetical protein [Chloroflexota bacterium]
MLNKCINKKISLILLFGIILLPVPPYFLNKMLGTEMFMVLKPGLPLAIVLSVFIAIGFMLISPFEEWKQTPRTWVSVSIVLSFILFIDIRYSIPFISTFALSEEFTRQYTISKKSNYRVSGCYNRHSIKLLESPDYFSKVCVSHEFWSSVTAGDRVLAQGKENALGIRIEKLQVSR